MKGDELLADIHAQYPSIIKILLTGEASLAGVTNAINRANLYRYISKPWEAKDLAMTLERGIESYRRDRLLAEQNEQLREFNADLEKKVARRTQELQYAKELLEKQKAITDQKNANLLDSINYASRIQRALMPSQAELREMLPEHALMYLPRDVISGDFYYAVRAKYRLILVVGDCTGHGVPGALLSIIGIEALEKAIFISEHADPADILNSLDQHFRKMLRQQADDQEALSSEITLSDGMDISVCVIDQYPAAYTETLGPPKLRFSGANQHLLVATDGRIVKLQGQRRPIGGYYAHKYKPFTSTEITLTPNATYYMLTDGFQDQFGGAHNRKFLSKKLQALLERHSTLPLATQKEALEHAFESWKGDQKQLDDVTLLAFRV